MKTNLMRPLTAVAALFLIGVTHASAATDAWVISADFEGGVLGTQAQSPNPDAFWDAAGDSKYVDSPVFTGSQAGSVSINQGETAFGNWGGAASLFQHLLVKARSCGIGSVSITPRVGTLLLIQK